MSLAHRFCLDASLQWRALAALQAVGSIWLVQNSQRTPSVTLLALVIWGGAMICVEDQLEDMKVCPSRGSLLGGFGLLVYTTWRGISILGLDSVVYVLPLLQGIGLALLARPVRALASFRDSLFILALFPLQLLISRFLPEYGLSVVTGKFSQLILMIFGVNASLTGRDLNLIDGGVRIAGSCNGVDLIAQLMVIAVVFVLAFPIKNRVAKLIYISLAPLVGFVVNASRISILAVINSSSIQFRKQAFEFLHDEWGGLLFAGLATLVIGQIYMVLINQQIGDRRG